MDIFKFKGERNLKTDCTAKYKALQTMNIDINVIKIGQ